MSLFNTLLEIGILLFFIALIYAALKKKTLREVYNEIFKGGKDE